jgi:glucan biosynthesis protein C
LLRSARFTGFITRIEGILTKPLALNIIIIPLILSQVILRRYFEVNTNDLINDGASMALYMIFFLSGFMLLPNKNITESIRRQRLLYLAETAVVTIIMFSVPSLTASDRTREIVWDVCSVFVALTCGLTALGFAKQYLNRDSKFRKLANEAIFPFYLLHQPVIVVVGYFMVRLDIAVLWKVLFITLTSFTLSAGLYWLVIRRINLLRIIFGMKIMQKENLEPEVTLVLSPVMVEANRTLPEKR